MRRTLIVFGVVGLLAGLSVAEADAATTAQLQAQVSGAMPSANAQVAAAAAQGTGAVSALVQKVEAMPMPAPDTTSVQQYALLQALQQYTTSSADPETVVVGDGGPAAGDEATPDSTPDTALAAPQNSEALTATATHCWFEGSHIASRVNFYQAGIKVGWAEKDHGYWCGNGTSITSNGLPGYYHQTWTPSLSPYCIVLPFTQNGWDGPNHSWAHGALVAHFGDYTPWTSCVTYLGNHTAIRIAANGHHDTYYDF